MLNNLKIMLGIEGEDEDAKLNLIINNTTARLKLLLGGIEPPEEMNHIILDVSVARFNKIGSEGMTSHSVEGESTSYGSNDFEPYMGEIQAYLDMQKESKRGKVRFI